MEKIEELTLYTIQLNDEIQILKSENNSLRQDLDELKIEFALIKEIINQ